MDGDRAIHFSMKCTTEAPGRAFTAHGRPLFGPAAAAPPAHLVGFGEAA
jgi:hypothetical protein